MRRAVLVALIALGARALVAQDAGPVVRGASADSLRTALLSVGEEWRRASSRHDSLAEVARARDAAARTDTVRVGGLRIAVPHAHRAHFQAAADSVWPQLLATFGAAAEQLADRPVRVDVREEAIARYGDGRTRYDVTSGTPGAMIGGGLVTADALPAELQRHAVAGMLAGLDPAVRAWLKEQVHTRPLAAEERTRLLMEQVTALSATARRCFAGDEQACRLALLLEPPADPITAWYAPADRVKLVEAYRVGIRSPELQASLERCTRASHVPSCDRVLRSLPTSDIYPPLEAHHRQFLLAVALRLGGDGAWARFAETPGGVAGRLEAAARRPVGALLQAWRTDLRAAHPPSSLATMQTIATALGTMLVCGALSLRSSRWR